MMIMIDMTIPDTCSECRLSVRHFGKLYCPYLDGRVGNEGKDGRCPLHFVTINDTTDKIKVTNCNDNDLISRQDALSCFHDWIDRRGDVHTADEMPEYQRIEQLPSAQPDVIRCKDCKFRETTWAYDSNANLHYCPLVDGVRREDFYCADAEERRTDETD